MTSRKEAGQKPCSYHPGQGVVSGKADCVLSQIERTLTDVSVPSSVMAWDVGLIRYWRFLWMSSRI